MYDVSANDPQQILIDRTGMSPDEVAEISAVMQALGELRQAEERLSQASQDYMKLGRTDMMALHFLIVEENQGRVTTAGAIAAHLSISTASTTKLLDRLARGEHITRSPHPTDRRALAIRITDATRRAAYETVGTQHARRFHAAARLTSQERHVVIDFLRDMTAEISKPPRFTEAAHSTDRQSTDGE